MATKPWVAILETAYRFEVSDVEWLDGIATAMRSRMDAGLGVYAYRYHASTPFDYRADPVRFYGCPPLVEQFGTGAVTSTSPEVVRDVLLAKTVGTTSDALGTKRHRRLFPPSHPMARIADTLAVNAIDPTGRGCMVVAPLPRITRLPPRPRALWHRVAAHVAAGHRLYGVVASQPLDAADAVIDARGRVLHAVGDARARSSRRALREAAEHIDRARLASTRDSAHVFDLWCALVSGCWSLVERYESDGRRVFVAWRNDPRVAIDRRLTPREAQVVCYASLGHANKLIAYELGIELSTVATHLAAAQVKLGATSRLALIELVRTLREQAPGRGDAHAFQVGGETFAVTSRRLETWEGLSSAQTEIANCLMRGMSNVEIAEARGTSVQTVANQITALYRRLGVNSRSELAGLARPC